MTKKKRRSKWEQRFYAWLDRQQEGGIFASLLSSVGVANLCMPLIQRICQWRLRKDFPHGFAVPFYLGHRVTLIFLGGCGTLATLCALGIHYL